VSARKPKPSVVFSVRMHPKMQAKVDRAARKAGMKRNAWIVQTLDRATGGRTAEERLIAKIERG
jgi:hypothetical protein